MDFYILIKSVKQGPFPLEELANKGITPNTMVWTVGFFEWKPAKQVPELSNLLSSLPPGPPPKTWFVESILVTIFCCFPFGIIGLIHAAKIEILYHSGQYEQALNQSKQAKKWTLWGFFSVLVFGILCVLINIVAIIIEQ